MVEARGARGRPVEQTRLPDGRLVQLGGELTGEFHTAYRGLVAELGLTIIPGFGDEASGDEVAVLADRRVVGDGWPWLSDADRASYDAAAAEFGKLAGTVDPTTPGRTRTPSGSTRFRSVPGSRWGDPERDPRP